jgi:hypothetical protein
VCGDEVVNGKPDAEIFQAAAARLGVDPAQCVAIEDAPSGIEVRCTCMQLHAELRCSRVCADSSAWARSLQCATSLCSSHSLVRPCLGSALPIGLCVVQAARAAGMRVVAVPSLIDKAAYKACDCTMLASLLDFRPEDFALPPFDDYVHGTVPLSQPWTLKGDVIKGFGRGSRVRRPAQS